MEIVGQGIGRVFGQIAKLFGLLMVGLLAALSVIAGGTKALVLVPALVIVYVITLIPYSPLYMIAASLSMNVEIAGPITVIRLAIVFGLFVAIIQGVKGQAPKLHVPWPDGGLALALFIWIIFSTLAVSGGGIVEGLGAFFVFFMVFFFMLIYVDTLTRFRQVIVTLLVVGVFQFALVVAESYLGIVLVGGFQSELAVESGESEVRVVGASAHPIFLASFFLMVSVLAVLFFVTEKQSQVRLLMLILLGFFLFGWLQAWSRSSWIGLGVMLGVAFLLWSTTTRMIAVVGGLFGFMVLAAHDFSAAAVMVTIDQLALVQRGSVNAGVLAGSDSFSWRQENWSAAISIWASHPIFGVGVDRVHLFMLDHLPPGAMGHRFVQAALPHNMFLQLLAEAGLPGFLLFTALWISALLAVFRAWGVEKLRPYAIAMFIIICGQLSTYVFNPIPREIWFTLAMSLALGRLARQYQRGEIEL